ncbi:hypothetical protein SAMD00019534_045880 [Acytostelium subglobosum LB1]|uniref:hypothetical protein n=1 Tax=Acytostelium subglobosum LB1 TaxID=1410327 RepID=UPI000644D4F6|nr:hypothetical protein SAMD00019534_045880 [Acytostelium subglobosum LB1]GAM21413.1 hypothetical protein SAMD00019534_045880 [Acytostelium subglobosum LB1]|eukprot:XP_012755532.1 hypothetical protein SAMD00019534_045880 [Acytostelium subglobosum LB1]
MSHATPKAIDALMKIPRGDFIPHELADGAYADTPLRCSRMGFNISAPHIYIVCLSELDIQPGQKFLDVGSGCGHMTCLGGYLVGPYGVSHGLEIVDEIMEFGRNNAIKFSEKSGIDLSNVEFKLRNCFLPDPEETIYDRINVGSTCPKQMVKVLLRSLALGGKLIAPVDDELRVYSKDNNGNITKKNLLSVRFSDLTIPTDEELQRAEFMSQRSKSLRINVPNDNIFQSYGKLVNSDLCTDFTFLLYDKQIYAHRLFLQMRTPKYFQTVEELKVVELPSELKYNGLIGVLEYIYSASMPMETLKVQDLVQSREHLTAVMDAAKYLSIDVLAQYCQDLLTLYNGVDVETDERVPITMTMKNQLQASRDDEKKLLQVQLSELLTKPKSPPGSTITLSAGGSKIICHKVILECRSTFFKSFFTSGMKETFSELIEIHGPFELDDFVLYLKYLYCGDEFIINNDNIVDILRIADYFNESCLKSCCERFLSSSIDNDNVCFLLQTSSNYNATQLKRVCIERILEVSQCQE